LRRLGGKTPSVLTAAAEALADDEADAAKAIDEAAAAQDDANVAASSARKPRPTRTRAAVAAEPVEAAPVPSPRVVSDLRVASILGLQEALAAAQQTLDEAIAARDGVLDRMREALA
jgi:hypothetical protein